MPSLRLLLVGLIVGVSAPSARAEEGLWTLEQAGRPDVGRRLGLAGDHGVSERLRANVVHFASGASGALVSTRGLVITVRSVVVPCLHAASRSGADHVRDGFRAGEDDDLKCPDLSLERLVASEDVTARLRQGLGRGDEIPGDRVAALEKQCHADSGLECRVTALFDGAVMRLERYQRHNDIRLVFAPEYRAAAFGSPTERMTFPRYALDVTFLRIYEQGKPLQSGPPIPWHSAGPAENDPVVVAAYPGETQRYLPWVFLQPLSSSVYRVEAQLAQTQAQTLFALSREQTETVAQEATRAQVQRLADVLRTTVALLQNQPMKRKQSAAEASWRSLFARAAPDDAKAAWASAATAAAKYAKFYQRYVLVEGDRVLPFGRLFDLGRKLVRFTEEKQRPEAERLSAYRGVDLAEIEREIATPVPLAAVAERSLMESGLLQLRAVLGPKDPLVLALAAESPADRAARIVADTKLMDAAVRKKILATGALGDAADDPLVVFVKTVEAEARPLRQRYEHEVQRHLSTYLRAVGQRLSAAADAGEFRYPDAGHDLRLSSGRVNGFLGFGQMVPAETFMAGLVVRAARARPGSPWELPASWRERQRRIGLTTPINFVVDADVGSGAPGGVVLNQKGELVGVVIDVTLKSAVNRFLYRGGDERAVAVHPAGIIEALRHVYDAGKLADELTGVGGSD